MKRFQNILLLLLLGVSAQPFAGEQNVVPVKVAAARVQHNQLQSAAISQEIVFRPAAVVHSDHVVASNAAVSPVPEPASWAMYVLGLGFVVYQIKRHRKKSASWDIRAKRD